MTTMSGKLLWDQVPDRLFETGLDRGVLYPNDGPAVLWNGLTGVDEAGGDSTESYYLDGRPYVNVPKPKEFAATIKAYTYPDEFSALMGLVEIADGMYLDSQMGDSFGLSYRTRIGNVVDGPQFGYKIHLIYNATVAPTDISYTPIEDTINPVEFSFNISAVPIAIPGYRGSAHIVIDTRHVDPNDLVKLEALLYGTGNSTGFLPDPSVILDMLSFTSGITITDNMDGTWTAEGPYVDIIKLPDGTFEIQNANSLDNGNGTYEIASTGEVIAADPIEEPIIDIV